MPREEPAAQPWVYRVELREVVGPFKSAQAAKTWADENTSPEEWVRFFLAKDRPSAAPNPYRGGGTESSLPPSGTS